jgi:hypothetical protein
MTIATLAFWKATAERTVGTMAAVAAALIGGDTILESLPGVIEVDWLGIVSTTATAGIVTILKAIGATGTGNGPSLTNSETLSG